MFTGIVTDVGTVSTAEQRGDLRLVIGTGYDTATIELGASIACSGVCLTVVERGGNAPNGWFAVDGEGASPHEFTPGGATAEPVEGDHHDVPDRCLDRGPACLSLSLPGVHGQSFATDQ